MKKILIIALFLSIGLNVFLAYIFLVKGETMAIPNDNRVAIITTKENKEFVMAEMRGFLETVKAINDGMIENNPDKIIVAAHKAGGAATEHAPAGLLKVLPISFKKLGFDTHDKFDELAETVKTRYDKDQTQKQLSNILGNCTSCHQSYKFETKQ
jgi:hypothetical protein